MLRLQIMLLALIVSGCAVPSNKFLIECPEPFLISYGESYGMETRFARTGYVLNFLTKDSNVYIGSVSGFAMLNGEVMGDSVVSGLWEHIDELRQLRRQIPKLTFDGREYWRVEHDVLLSDVQLFEYVVEHCPQSFSQDIEVFKANVYSQPVVSGDTSSLAFEFKEMSLSGNYFPDLLEPKIIWEAENGHPVIWDKTKEIRYFFDMKTFPERSLFIRHCTDFKTRMRTNCHRGNLALKAFQVAANDWSSVVGIDFVPVFDASKAHVHIRYDSENRGPGMAEAFALREYPKKHTIWIRNSFFDGTYSVDGIMRHELGHVLGFYHEHIRREVSEECRKELPGVVINSTLIKRLFGSKEYDPQSVMHYYCSTAGTREMRLSPMDVEYAKKLYQN